MTTVTAALAATTLIAVAGYLQARHIAWRRLRRVHAAEDCITELEEAIGRHEAALNLMSEALLGSGDVDWGDVVWNYLRTRPDGDVIAQLELEMQMPDWSDE